MQRYHLPGLVLGIVEHGEIVYARAGGERAAGEGKPVTHRTLFKIASNSKSMTTATLARLVDAGKLRWDDPVTKHLPAFRMADSWVTREMQVRDLLIHNSGLPAGAGDLMLWPEPNTFTRSDVIAGLEHLKPAYSFRSRYAYDNVLYIVAGELAAAVAQRPYEDLVRQHVFEPLGMKRCRVGAWKLADLDGDVAQPHMRDGDRNVVIRRDGDTVPRTTMDAAGGIRCSLDDMLAWIQAWLRPEDPSKPWLSNEQRDALWTGHMPMPISARLRAWDDAHFLAYGYGWRLSDVDGTLKVSHTGTLAGMYSVTTLLPDENAGFFVAINGDGDEARTVLNQVLVKRYTDPQAQRDVAYYADAIAKEAAAPAAQREPPDTTARAPATVEAMSSHLGRWRDPWLGEALLCADGERVRFTVTKSPRLAGTVMRAGERWLIDWDDVTVDPEAWLTFATDAARGAAVMTLAKLDPLADFSSDYEDLRFVRSGDCVSLSHATTPEQAGLVDLRTLVPDIELDMRYAGSGNFVGQRIDGYDAPKCLLLRPAAEALQQVEAALRGDGLRLRLFDCYRPARAVRHFVAWAQDPADQRTKAMYYPNLEKSQLLGDYIAPLSGHSRGATVDLTLLQCDQRGANCEALDMGTPFDFFDAQANTGSSGISPEQRRHREQLLTAMQRFGFENYPMEWWHFTFEPEPSPHTVFDVPVR